MSLWQMLGVGTKPPQESEVMAAASPPDGEGQEAQGPPVVAVIGAGFLGTQIIAEMLLLGSRVSVYDQGLAKRGTAEGQFALNQEVLRRLRHCEESNLLALAGLNPTPISDADLWIPVDGEGPRRATFCDSVAAAANGADIVLEAVPDSAAIKSAVFAEAMTTASPKALLATNTLSIPLARLQEAVSAKLAKEHAAKPRVVGLRFLSPVVFVPFVEVTLTSEQHRDGVREELLALLRRWGKTAFGCDADGAVGEGNKVVMAKSYERIRLDDDIASRRQVAEAKLRCAHSKGAEAVAALGANGLYDFGEERCCVCLDAKPQAVSEICGHRALCNECADIVERGTKQCPICRLRFARRVDEHWTI